MKLKNKITAICFGIVSFATTAQNNTDLKLWYDKPATIWNEALPLGNGRLGAMVFGDPSVERLQLNEETIWAGSPNSNAHTKSIEALPKVRQLVFEGKFDEAQDLATRDIMSQTNDGMPYQTFGSVYISFPGHQKYTNYYRDLNIENATAKVKYTVNGVEFTREILTAFADQVIVVKLSASQPGQITANVFMNSPIDKTVPSTEGNQIILSGVGTNFENVKGKVKFQGRIEAKNKGGEVSASNGILSINKADEVTLYISIATNFKNYKDITEDEIAKSKSFLEKALPKSFDDIKKAHIAYYQKFFNRVALDLGKNDLVAKPTNERIRDFKTQFDPQLASLYFQFGRYLLISSSQPGGQPANLQGIWNDMVTPPWDSKYTTNINAEMNYWPAEVTNLSEMHEPFIQMAKELSVTGAETAKMMYNAKGWVLHHNTDIWRVTAPVDQAASGMWPTGGAWVCQDLWERYLYTGDKKYLAEVYPIIKGSASFFLDFMIKDPNTGYLVVVPSSSPENTHAGGTGKSTIASGTTMDNQLVFDLFTHVIEASKLVAPDADFTKRVQEALNKMAPMKVGKHSQLQEWQDDWDNPKDNHRHVSHLYGLFPSNQISPIKTPELFEASKQSLIYRTDESTGWSMGWKVNLWARLLDGNHAYKLIQDQLHLVTADQRKGGGTYPNMLDAHQPFQIDGNFGCTAGIAEMLMQSQEDAIHLLPALPTVWKDGSIKGLVTRGGFVIDMTWKNNKVSTLKVYSKLGGNCRLKLENTLKADKGIALKKAKGKNPNPLFYDVEVKKPIISKEAKLPKVQLPKYNEYDVEMKAGQTYSFSGN
ncbi:glycoside hydrolase family 95 protein [Flavobacterium hibisci]|uniref:glycoside hydrolase family 95 protein n=1 Tax=Flavobacterium hibisci TaxID=1914462 RepID=UPI001CBE2620|nr:glycoside hydrolase family 95 protein [Flavobacterium hibisci]MBZ4043864.1 glycoside hydrolase family 95 protein [Flavobacterium hibisci]